MKNGNEQGNRNYNNQLTLAEQVSSHYDERAGIVRVTPEFEQTFAFDGQLGVNYSPESTIFRVWSPVAIKVELIIFNDFNNNEKERHIMSTISPGVFEKEVLGDLDETAYLYALTYPDGQVVESMDPYATAATVNGERAVVVNLANTNPENWARMEPFSATTDAVIYEAHIRDFTISADSGAKNKGKFLGMIEKETKTPAGHTTGLDYLKELGITHLQLLPMFDFYTVDERNPASSYNWGYDPLNFNVPEGSYATNPYEPKTRIMEMKQMIQGLHDAGIRVIMDVVYNHVYKIENHSFSNTAPGYFFRRYEDGSLSDGTGVGNDLASERVMARKYIVDSVKYWAQEFNLDGFRFDLMGIHDVETMNEVREALNEIDPSMIILGEGWELNTNLPAEEKATQKNADRLPGIGFFNDALRLAVKGSDMNGGADTGFISGKAYQEQWIAINQQGGTYYPEDMATYRSPDQLIQYVEAHDNHTLYDKLQVSMPADSERTRLQRHLLASSLVLLSQGVPFIHAGQEFFRTKKGDANSYQSPDEINLMDWTRKDAYPEAVAYLKGLIALRKSEPLFRMRTTEAITKHMEVLKADYYQIIWQLEDQDRLYYVCFNGNGDPAQFEVEEADYQVLVHDGIVTLTNPPVWEKQSTITIEGFSTTVIRKLK